MEVPAGYVREVLPAHLQGDTSPDDIELSTSIKSRSRYDMTEEEKELMKRYGITVEPKSVYSYKGYKYEHLKDALNYAKVDPGAAHKPSVSRA